MRHSPYRARQINKNTWVVDIGAVCYSYLLVGEEKALVIDTGMNPANLREFYETITDKPMMVVNTHGHGDHTLCNGYFDEVYMHPNAIIDAKGGDLGRDDVPTFKPIPVTEGHVFELGGRNIEVLETPCHSPGDLMFIDRENKLLFTGDNLEVGQVLIFYGNGEVGATVKNHLDIMKKIEARYDEYDYICPAHNGSPIDKSYVKYFIELDQMILDGKEGTSDLSSPSFDPVRFGMSEERTKFMRCMEYKGLSLVYDIRKIYESKGLWGINSGNM